MTKRKSKTIQESATQRIYRDERDCAVSCVIQHQFAFDPSDGQEAGYYGWCGPVGDQSDFVLGPYVSALDVFAAYEARRPKHVRVTSVTLFQTRSPAFRERFRMIAGGKS